jgi:inositol-phosphate transport system ATP-binding protein
VTLGEATLPIAGADGAVTVGLRPEHLRFAATGLAGRVVQLEPMGREILYVVDSDLGRLHVLEQGSLARHDAGEAVHIDFTAEDVLVFGADGRLIEGAHVRPAA